MTEAPAPRPRRGRDLLVLLLFLLLPAALLGESLFTADKYLPFDIAEFPPIAQTLTQDEIREIRSTANYDATEAPIWFASELQLAREALQDRQLPHWNPYVRGGAPMLAHGHMGLLNPLHWPALAFDDPADGLLYLTYLMFALAGALMFGFLRAMQLGAVAAAFGALGFAWSGTLTANGHWFMRMEPLVMFPGMLWGIVAIADRKGRARALPAAGLAVATAACWLSGFPQYGIPVTLLTAAFGAVFVLREFRDGSGAALKLFAWLAGAGLLGVLLAMPQLLQMLYFYPDSNRPIAESLDRAAEHQFAPFGFLGYLMPDAFSHPGDRMLPSARSPIPYLWSDLRHWETGAQLLPNYNFTEYAVFPGTMVLLMALLALVMRGPRWRWFAVAALAGVWLLATGVFGSHHAYRVPGVKAVPPYRFAGPACALLAMLAAVGFDGLRQRLRPWSMRVFAILLVAGGVAMFVLAARQTPAPTTADDPALVEIVERYRDRFDEFYPEYPIEQITPANALGVHFSRADPEQPGTKFDYFQLGRQRLQWNLRRGGIGLLLGAALLVVFSLRRREAGLRGWPTAVAFGLAALELGLFSFHLNRGQACEHSRHTAVHAFLRDQRDALASGGGFLVGRGAGTNGVYNLPGGTLASDHIRDLNFYTFVDNKSDLPLRKLYGDGFILRDFVCDAVADDEKLQHPYWDLMGLRYVLATAPMQHAGRRVGPEQIGDGYYYIYERPLVMPRAWVTRSLRVIDNETELVDQLADPTLDPRAGVFVNSADADALGTVDPGAVMTPRPVTFLHEDSKRLTLRIPAGASGYLVLADTFFPGWEAQVDDQPVPIARGNLYQRVIAVPGRECIVQFRYRAEGLVGGAAIGGAAGLGWIALLFVGVWPRRRQRVIADNVEA